MIDLLDYKAAGFWFGVGQWVFNGLVALYLLISRRATATNQRVDALGTRMYISEKEILQLRSDLSHLPDQAKFERLGNKITDLTKELGEFKGKMDGINRVVDLINEHFISGKRL